MTEPTLDSYLAALASAEPTPGGGSAAALVGALGAALCAMVARLTAAGRDGDRHRTAAAEIAAEADRLRGALAAARLADEHAYAAVVAAGALPKASTEEKAQRTAALQAALAGAAAAPLTVAGEALAVLRLAGRALELENTHLISDVVCAAEFARAALAASAANVRINHRFLKDAELVAQQAAALRGFEDDARAAIARVRTEAGAVLA